MVLMRFNKETFDYLRRKKKQPPFGVAEQPLSRGLLLVQEECDIGARFHGKVHRRKALVHPALQHAKIPQRRQEPLGHTHKGRFRPASYGFSFSHPASQGSQKVPYCNFSFSRSLQGQKDVGDDIMKERIRLGSVKVEDPG
jgi:hypothetical protein